MIFAFLITFIRAPFFVEVMYATSMTPSGGAGMTMFLSAADPVGNSFSRRRYVPGTGRADNGMEFVNEPASTEKRLTPIRRLVLVLRRLASTVPAVVSVAENVTLPLT